jgi:heme exporter protein A
MKLVVKNLGFVRNDNLLFKNFSANLNSGQAWEIHGNNGTGKSTLLRILAGLLIPSHGQVIWRSAQITQDIHLSAGNYQDAVLYLGHHNGLKDYLTCRENLKLTAAYSNLQFSLAAIDAALSKSGLHRLRNTQALHLSAGQYRRLGLTRLLLQSATLWLLDEPTTALDREGQQWFAHICQQHLANAGMIIAATHSPLLTHDVQCIRLRTGLQPELTEVLC